ncbi:MAG: DNA topoisomerase (ATP-hydrolyzing) subunit B [Parcubacteria group bacterium]|nr:DNA topoisomerase (ATP-hydrolyzing) subunit B [Parcubacteria group bacterium]
MSNNNNYTAKDIYVLEGLEPVRKRPGMYIGSTGVDGLHHLVWEVVDNSIDEAMAGYAKNIEAAILEGERVRVRDDGRGIPVETHHQTKKSALETVMTTLHAGGKFGGESYKIAGGLHGVGVSVVNALSKWLKAEVCRDGALWAQEYSRGVPKAKVKKVELCSRSGTTVTFEPDDEIFKEIKFSYSKILDHLRQQAYLTKGVRIAVTDERVKPALNYSFYFEGGIVSYIRHLNQAKVNKQENVFYCDKNIEGMAVEVAFQYTEDFQGLEYSFANNIHTPEGGMHLTGFRTALTRTLNDYARKNGFVKDSDDNLTGEDVREGLTVIVSVKLREPQFEGQTKAKLGNPEARTAVEAAVAETLAEFLEKNPGEARTILEKTILAKKAREAAKAARETVIRRGVLEGLALPGKLADCSNREPAESELFIVEGDSAGGCFSGDTKIALADGRDINFRELVEEHDQGKQNYCYTIQSDGSVGITPIRHPRVTRKNADVITVVLDTGESITCTPDHAFMLRDGSYKEARHLTRDDSLMPLRRKISKLGGRITVEGYEMVLNPAIHKWIFTHVLTDRYNLAKRVYHEKDGEHRHHIDFNKRNNNPDNLVRVSKEDHLQLHREILDKTIHRPDVKEKTRQLHQTPEFRKKMSAVMSQTGMRAVLSARAKKQWDNEEYKVYMASRFLEFYRNNAEYREKNIKFLNEEQKKYWRNQENKKKQAERVTRFFKDHPEKREELRLLAMDQWSDEDLRQWRSEKTKEQWTLEFRVKRKKAYDKTYLHKALAVLHSIYQQKGAVDLREYQRMRLETNDKTLLRFSTICERFFGGDDARAVEAVQQYNHRIKKIVSENKRMDVYDLEVEGTHNFSLASGVFVHNSAKMARSRIFQAILPLRGKILNVEKSRLDKMLANKEIRALVIALGSAIADEFDIEKVRYHRIVLMTDADVDGAHIRTLLLTLFYRYFPKIIDQGYLYIAQPPLYRVQKGKDVRYVYSDTEKEKVVQEISRSKLPAPSSKLKIRILGQDAGEEDLSESTEADKAAEGEKVSGGSTLQQVSGQAGSPLGVSIQRYKGLGEMDPQQLWETTMDPAVRVLRQVTIKDAAEADKIFDILMGTEVAPRKRFIQTHAKAVKNLDV